MINAYVSIAFESISIIFLLILFLACLFQRNKTTSTKYIMAMSVLSIILLIIQIPQWYADIQLASGETGSYSPVIIAIIFTVDYGLVYWNNFLSFKYLQFHLENSDNSGVGSVKVSPFISRFLIIWGILFQAAMFVCSVTGYIFYQTDTGVAFYMPLYSVFLIAGFACMVTSIIMTVYYHRILGKYDTMIYLLYFITLISIYPLSIIYSTGIGYIVTPVMIYVLYLGINNRKEIQYLEQRALISQRESEIERKNMQIMISQIQPHFLYNTLSVIDYLCGKDVELARKAINNFSDYLRTNMESLRSFNLVPFEKELEHTKTYLWIEQMRFIDILKIEYDIQVTDFKILPLTLQPIAENAVKHGIRGREEGGTVKISTKREKNDIVITVEDDGKGFDTAKAPDTERVHVGIENVRSRLAMIDGSQLIIESTPGVGTVASIILSNNKGKDK